ncbi:MAG: hypothetical protein QM703_13925 [Gemmatales bacterium]
MSDEISIVAMIAFFAFGSQATIRPRSYAPEPFHDPCPQAQVPEHLVGGEGAGFGDVRCLLMREALRTPGKLSVASQIHFT